MLLLITALATGSTSGATLPNSQTVNTPQVDDSHTTVPSSADERAGTTAPKHLKGRLSFSDLPSYLREPGARLAVTVNYQVGLDGVPSDCNVVKSSGKTQLDHLTCVLIEQRFRYAPAKGRDGQDEVGRIIETHTWAPH